MTANTSKETLTNYIFHGTRTECMEGRFIEALVKKAENQLEVREFFLSFDMKLSDAKSVTYDFALPDSFQKDRVVGRPMCIGCKDEFLILQYITASCKYIRFMAVFLKSKTLQCFEDTVHFFTSDFTAISPLRCHISPDKTLCVLRLPQAITKLKKWTKMFKVKNTFLDRPITPDNVLLGTQPYTLRDRMFHCFLYLKNGDILTADLEPYLERCKFTVSCSDSGENLMQKVHRMGVRSVTITEPTSESDDSLDDNQKYFTLTGCSLCLNRAGDIVVLYCQGVTDETIPTCKLFFYNAETLKNMHSEDFQLDKRKFKLDTMSLTVTFSLCDTKLQVWLYKRGASHHVVVKKINIESLTNERNRGGLKMLCRQTILSTYGLYEIVKLPIPASLINYLQFKD